MPIDAKIANGYTETNIRSITKTMEDNENAYDSTAAPRYWFPAKSNPA